MSEPQSLIAADPRKRRQALWVAVAMLAVGVVAFVLLRGQIAQINVALDNNDHEQAIWLSRRLGVVVLGSLLIGAVGLAMVCEKVARDSLLQGHFPPSGVTLLFTVRVRTGAELRRIAWLLRTLAVVLILLASGLAGWSGLMLYRLY